ncbi:MAG: hypothetical protein JNL82_40170 [Myxococcales bacterium]|nr:hypothetical protein [Myxococcales bacterium]
MLVSLRARTLVALVVATSLTAPPASAAPAAGDARAQADFEAGFNAGQTEFDAGKFVDAARTWVKAADNLKETAKNKDNRQAVYEYIADAWAKALEGNDDPALLREGFESLDSYCKGFTTAYGTETPILPKIVATRDALGERVKAAEDTPKPPTPEGPEELPPGDDDGGDAREPAQPQAGPKWKGLAIGGGVALGLGVGGVVLGAVGGVKGQKLEEDVTDLTGCDAAMPAEGQCKELVDDGKRANTLAVVGGVVGGVLLVTGAVLLGVGLKRRAAGKNQAFAPALGPNFVGFTLRGSF